jgi:serine/threonine-protein kinase
MFGKYKITGMLGKGGMGEVYEAEDTSKGRTVALKILAEQYSHDENFRARFQRESRAAAILQEPHVIPIHDWGEIDGNLYIDMRLVRGSTMQDLLVERPLEPARAVELVSQVAAALDAAHAAGLIHRDVKPQNIIVTPNDFSYLVDFGIAEAEGDAALTMTGTYVGTVSYMAPERFSGDRNATSAVDVYSLACVLYECLTREPPFPTKPGMGGIEQAMVGHLSTPPPSPSRINGRVPQAFDEVIARGMAKEPDDRYGSAGALARAAKRALEGGTAPPTGPTVQAYGASPPTMAAPPLAYGSAPQAYGSGPQTYGSAPQTYGSAPQAYGTAPHAYGSAPQAYSSAPDAYGSAPYTMQAPVGPPPGQYAAPSVGPYPPQYGAPPVAQPPAESGSGQRSWLLPTIIAVSVAVILGSIGVVIVTQTTDEDKGTGTASQSSGLSRVSTVTQTQSGSQTSGSSVPPPALAPPPGPPPPLVSGPDATGTDCNRYVVPTESGFGINAGRGTSATTCTFTKGVLDAYWRQFGRPTVELRTVSAAGAVSCGSILTSGVGCDGYNFLMQCQGFAGQSYITCTGGRDAKVYIF